MTAIRSTLSTSCAALALLALAGCAFMAERTAPPKQASMQRSEAARKADALFWATFHGGDYAGASPRLTVNESRLYGGDLSLLFGVSRRDVYDVWVGARAGYLYNDLAPSADGARVYQAKGYPYSMRELFGPSQDTTPFEGGTYVTLDLGVLGAGESKTIDFDLVSTAVGSFGAESYACGEWGYGEQPVAFAVAVDDGYGGYGGYGGGTCYRSAYAGGGLGDPNDVSSTLPPGGANFQVTGSLLNQVPTPASLPLVGVGLAALGALRRRR